MLLDEPTVGLDPQVRGDLWALIDRLRADGVTVLMSTHYIEEAERLADDVAVMSHGRVDRPGLPRGARSPSTPGAQARRVLRHRRTRVAAIEARRAGGRAARPAAPGPSVSVLRAEQAARRRSLGRARRRTSQRAANLEDVFVLLTGEVLED